jgi:tRNA (guanosine-2'-O-)-methyltransferase
MLINYRERHRRMRAVDEAVWEAAEDESADEGLRQRYGDIERAPIRLHCYPLFKEVNHGGILRAAEAFRIECVTFSPEADEAVDGSGQRGTKRWQPHRWVKIEQAMGESQRDGYRLVSLSLSDQAQNIDNFDWSFPLALVIGGELTGVPEHVEGRCEASIAIPLYGLVQSLNVAVATAVALREAVKAYSRQVPEFLPARAASRRLLG